MRRPEDPLQERDGALLGELAADLCEVGWGDCGERSDDVRESAAEAQRGHVQDDGSDGGISQDCRQGDEHPARSVERCQAELDVWNDYTTALGQTLSISVTGP
jgi:hypothetical protein